MTSRTVMAARIGPASLRSGPRHVLAYVPKNASQDQIDIVLKPHVRDGDQLLYAGRDPLPSAEPDLIVVILDPLEDNIHSLTSPARVMARYQHADFLITELPDQIN